MSAQEDPVVYEVTTTLFEWHKVWISIYLDDQTNLFNEIANSICTLVDLRAKLINILKQNASSQYINNIAQTIAELKCDIVTKLDHGNRLLNLDLVPREPSFSLVDPIELSPIRLFELHELAASKYDSTLLKTNKLVNGLNRISLDSYSNVSDLITNSRSSSLESYSSNFPTKNSSHLQITLNSHSLNALPAEDMVELNFSLIDFSSQNNNYINPVVCALTDKFIVHIQRDEIICGVGSTVFTNIGAIKDRDICLHIQIFRIGKMILAEAGRTAFGKQPSSHNLYVSNHDGSVSSINSASKYTPNGLSRSRHSTIGIPDPSPSYRRPFGATIVPLRDFFKDANGQEHGISIKVPASNESEFSQIHELYPKRNYSFKINPNLPNVQLEVLVKFVSCPQDVVPQLISLAPCITESRSFPEVTMPGVFKNDLYLILESAEFEKGGKSISKNIEASISLIDKSGLVIDGCISPGSNCKNTSFYRSCVFYHSNSPKWNESIKINVPLSEFDTAHIRLEFRHCSTKDREKRFLGFAFLPLSDEDGTVIANKSHELFIYKYESQVYDDESLNLSKYTSLPYGPASRNMSKSRTSSFSHSSREIVTVHTFLLSTKLTQNSDLLNLLRWRELVKHNSQDFEGALKKFLTIGGDEIVKFLQDILDTLFDTFTLYSTSEDDYSALIFKVLIHIFLLLEEPEYQHFKPVLDTYASNNFSATLVYKGLLACVQKCLEYSTIVERHAPIQKCFKTIKYVFQFIVQSKLLFSKATGEQNDEHFLADLRRLFHLFELLLSYNDPKLVPIQVTFLESFPGTIEQLVKVLSPIELAKVLTSLAGSVGFILPQPLARAKLVFMLGTANSGIIRNQEVRLHVIDNFCKHLDVYIKHSQELELCCEVLGSLVVKIHDYHWPSIYQLHQLASKPTQDGPLPKSKPIMTVGEMNLVSLNGQSQSSGLDVTALNLTKELEPIMNLMNPLLSLIDRLMKDYTIGREVVQRYSACLLTILKLMSKQSYEKFMKKRRVGYPELCNIFRSSRSMYHRDWSVMQLTSHCIMEHPINEIFRDIKIKSDSCSLTKQLSSYINLIVDYITHPSLQLEVFSERKRNFILSVFGDLRLKYAAQLVKFWNELTKSNISDLIPTSLQPLLDASLLPNEPLQHALIPVFYDIIDAEEFKKSNSRQFERCFIDLLDLFMNLDRGNDEFVENFKQIMKDLIKGKSPSWEQRGFVMVDSFVELMHLLIKYRKSIEINENQSKKMSCLVDLLNFYKNHERFHDLHVRYLFKLCDMHLELSNHVEAAFTLKLYSDEMKWRDQNLSQLEGYRPEEQEWKRKEALYQRIIDYFDEGKCWEEAIPLCKELASFYETFLVDYEKVSAILKKLAKFLDCILTEHRPSKEYFRVEFLGSDLPEFIRDKEFIYRAGGYERLPSFIEKTATEFPDIKILNFKNRQSFKKSCPGQYMFVSNVKPLPFLPEQFKNGIHNINDKIIHYYLYNRVDTFSYDIPMIRAQNGCKDRPGETNVRNLWVRRHKLKTRKQLPHILPWSEVVSQSHIEITPLENAIETISGMNLELSKLILGYKNEPHKPIGQLTMRLQGVIEAPVNGGPSVFVNAFLRHRHDDKSIPDIESVHKLRDLIKEQFSLLETGLTLHFKLAPPEVMPLHSLLETRLKDIMKSFHEGTEVLLPKDG